MSPATPRRPKNIDFEAALGELEGLVARLEQGELPLEESLRAFERGVVLTRECQTALQAAQAKVDILLNRDTTSAPTPFATDDDDSDDAPDVA